MGSSLRLNYWVSTQWPHRSPESRHMPGVPTLRFASKSMTNWLMSDIPGARNPRLEACSINLDLWKRVFIRLILIWFFGDKKCATSPDTEVLCPDGG